MKKVETVLIVIGIILFAVGVFVIYRGFVSQTSEENGIVFEKKITAQITNMYIAESSTDNFKTQGGRVYAKGNVTYTYYVEIFVPDGGYSIENAVPAKLYKEYEQLEKNKDMEFNLYRNADSAAFFSLKDIEGATEDYQEIHVTKSIGVRMVIGLLIAMLGLSLAINVDKLRQKRKKAE